jgi:putative FmdB family regulatory protein
MPIYEYHCPDCQQRVTVFFRSIAQAANAHARCPHCEGERLQRLVSRVATPKSEDSRLDDIADPSLMSGLEQEDPRALASFMRRMSDEMGEPMDAELQDVVGRLESGEAPGAVESSLPDS